MDRLSPEIRDLIAQQFEGADLYCCIKVCKLWYAMFIEHHYKKPQIFGYSSSMRLLKSLTYHTECRGAGQYIKTLSINHSGDLDPEYIDHEEVIIITALLNCPNIENLYINSDVNFLHSFKTCTSLELRKLRTMSIRIKETKFTRDMMDCYHKFRSSLTELNLYEVAEVTSRYLPEEILMYIEEFPQLEILQLDLSDASFSSSPKLHDILSRCPSLKSLKYRCSVLHTESVYLSTRKEYPNLQNLQLIVKDLHTDDISYIKSKCTHLTDLSITVLESIQNESYLCKSIMEMDKLDQFKIDQDNSTNVNLVDQFWRNADLFPVFKQGEPQHFAAFGLSPVNKGISLYMNRDSRSHQKTLSTNSFIDSNATYEHILGEHYPCITELLIMNSSQRFRAAIHDINKMCPSLSGLVIKGCYFIPSHEPSIPNYTMKTMTMDDCLNLDTAFRDIEVTYPSLQKLSILSVDFNLHTGNNVYTIQLPETGLKSLTIGRKAFTGAIVIREENGIPIRSWHYNHESKSIIVTQKEDISSLLAQLHVTSSVCLLKSSTVENVK
ncbi:hypothetical protein BDB01DRAFT_372580 [Pilobolus umbonatus]|nr:hypothetical protein BDB01DRAFT_372580 [Pilobolus umbonatus]